MSWYDVQFMIIQGFSLLMFPTSIAAAVWSFQDARWLFVLVWAWTWFLVSRLRGYRIALRAGAWYTLNHITPTPCTPEQLLEQIHGVPTVIGSGWGFFIKRLVTEGPKIYMHNFCGPMPGERRFKDASKMKWAAGTKISTVSKALLKEGKTFPSQPSNEDITLGSWYAYGNHGSGGDDNMGSSKTLLSATVIDMRKRMIFRNVEYRKIRTWFDTDPTRYLIVDVAFKNLVKNIDIQKDTHMIPFTEKKGIAETERWLENGAVIRVCFFGRARDHALGIRWTKKLYNYKHRDPHCCSRVCTYTQADVCSIIGGYHEPMNKWNGMTTLYEANRWVPSVSSFGTFSVIFCGYRNFEIACRFPKDGERLWRLMKDFKDMHDDIGGRTEFRYGTEILFIDVVITKGFDVPFEILETHNVYQCALHPGKWTMDTYPVERVTLGNIYYQNTDVLY